MCTVTYIPGGGSTLFSSCRDEDPKRKRASAPAVVNGPDRTLFYPADGSAGGTWIGLNDAGHLLILLNGGFTDHSRLPFYKKSRGIVMKEMLDSKDPVATWLQMDLDHIEPFTIIAWINKKLHQLVWTGFDKSHMHPDPFVPHIWSSATLYGKTAREKRSNWFTHFLAATPTPNSSELLHYLMFGSPRDQVDGFTMNRNELVKTCSISIVEMKEDASGFLYHDLLGNVTSESIFSFDKKQAEMETLLSVA